MQIYTCTCGRDFVLPREKEDLIAHLDNKKKRTDTQDKLYWKLRKEYYEECIEILKNQNEKLQRNIHANEDIIYDHRESIEKCEKQLELLG